MRSLALLGLALLALARPASANRSHHQTPEHARPEKVEIGAPVEVEMGTNSGRPTVQVMIDGKSYWSDGSSPARPPASAHLLPNYDEFFIGYRDRSAMGKRTADLRPVTGWNPDVFAHVVVINGQLVGGWKRSPGRGSVTLSFSLVDALSAAERARVLAEVRRFERFLGTAVELNGLDGPKRASRR